jgi:protoporphyrinogen oxidase
MSRKPPYISGHVAIIGGGITGLTAAFYLQRAGIQVTVLESKDSVGGLSCSQDYGEFQWDRFYHCVLTSDDSLLQLVEDLDLSDHLRWKNTEVGFYSGGQLYKMTRPVDLLRYPHLTLWQKLRFGLGTIYASRLKDGIALESILLEKWIVRIFGEAVYRNIWEPLLRCKLGETRKKASAAFLWATIRRLYSTRNKGADKQERLGYIHGGYRVVMDRLCERIRDLGGTINTSVVISKICQSANGSEVNTNRGAEYFDACLLTVPNHAVAKILPDASPSYLQKIQSVEYLGIVCVVLVLRKKLGDFYVTNITDKAPFTGVIEMTNLIDSQIEATGKHLVYVPKYTPLGDPLFLMSEKEIWAEFRPALFQMYPVLCDEDIEKIFVFRERTVQPIPLLHYSKNVPTVDTGIPHVFLANTSQIINNTLNNNVMTMIARSACASVLNDLRSDNQSRTTNMQDVYCDESYRVGEKRADTEQVLMDLAALKGK